MKIESSKTLQECKDLYVSGMNTENEIQRAIKSIQKMELL